MTKGSIPTVRPEPTTERLHISRTAMLVILAVLVGLSFAIASTTWVTVQTHREFNPQHRHFAPSNPGSGLHLPLDGGR